MLRTIQHELLHWREDTRRFPLLLRGARQVGKTFAVRQFAQAHFRNCVELNFELQPELRSLKQFMDECTSPLGVRISPVPLTLSEQVLSVPLYAIGQLPGLIRESLARHP